MPSRPHPTPTQKPSPDRETPRPIHFKDWASI